MKIFIFYFALISLISSFYCQNKFDLTPICSENDNNPIFSNWESLGPIEDVKGKVQNIGFVSCIAVDTKNNNHVFLGSNTGGLYSCENFLEEIPKWKNLTNHLRLPSLGITQIVIDHSNSNIIYVATGYTSGAGLPFGVGILKSVDGGQNWKCIGPTAVGNNNVVNKLILDRTNPKILFCTINDLVYKSENAGLSWVINFQLPPSIGENKYNLNSICRIICDFEQSYENPKVYFFSTNYTGTNENSVSSFIYKTVDCGKNWEKINFKNQVRTDKIMLAINQIEPKSVWITYTYKSNNSNKNKIEKSIDLGENWFEIFDASISGAGFFRQDIEISPTDPSVIYLGGYYVNKSIDSGKTFKQSSSNLHVDCRFLSILKGSEINTNGINDVILNGNDGGINFSIDGSKSWLNKNGIGLNIKQFIGIGVGNRSKNTIVGGTQDNDLCIFDSIWHIPQLTNDGADGIVHNKDNNLIYAEPYCCDDSQLKLRTYNKVNNEWKIINSSSPLEKHGNNLRPINQFSNGQIIMGFHDVWKTNSTSLKWSKISDFSTNFPLNTTSKIKSLAISKEDTTKIAVIYPGPSWSDETKESYLLTTQNGGGLKKSSWKDNTLNLPKIVLQWLEMNCVEINQNSDNEIYIGLGSLNFSSDSMVSYPYNGSFRVIKSNDFGETWEDYSKNLPPFPVKDLVTEEGIDGAIYAATEVGVFYTNSALYDQYGWLCFSSNLPVGIVSDLEINYCTKKIVAGLFGYGLWMCDLATSNNQNFLPFAEKTIKGKVIWNEDKDINSTIILKKNSKLSITNAKIAVAKNCSIILEKGAVLELNNSLIKNFCGEQWNGIVSKDKNSRVNILLNSNSEIKF
jgi:hypothetical protein